MPYRILTLDGGGAWALIEVKALIDLFGGATRGNEVLAAFDLVAANSGAKRPKTVEAWMPAFSKTRPLSMAMVPPPPGPPS